MSTTMVKIDIEPWIDVTTGDVSAVVTGYGEFETWVNAPFEVLLNQAISCFTVGGTSGDNKVDVDSNLQIRQTLINMRDVLDAAIEKHTVPC